MLQRGRVVTRWALVCALLVAMGCVGEVVDSRESLPRVDHACRETFDLVVEGWERMRGPVPARCLELKESYTLELVGPDEMPCDVTLKKGQRLVGCTVAEEQHMYLLEGASEATLVDFSAHEWVHALQQCIEGAGAGGNLHAEPDLWGPEGVLTFAKTNSALGECL